MTNSMHTARELDARSGDGLDIRLLWNPAADAPTLDAVPVGGSR